MLYSNANNIRCLLLDTHLGACCHSCWGPKPRGGLHPPPPSLPAPAALPCTAPCIEYDSQVQSIWLLLLQIVSDGHICCMLRSRVATWIFHSGRNNSQMLQGRVTSTGCSGISTCLTIPWTMQRQDALLYLSHIHANQLNRWHMQAQPCLP